MSERIDEKEIAKITEKQGKIEDKNWDTFFDSIYKHAPQNGHFILEQLAIPPHSNMRQYKDRREYYVSLPESLWENDKVPVSLDILTVNDRAELIPHDLVAQLKDHGFDPEIGEFFISKYCEITSEVEPVIDSSGKKRDHLDKMTEEMTKQIHDLISETAKRLNKLTGWDEWEREENEKYAAQEE